ncbi:MAG: hypothetical protein GY812_17710 [Actinomycetia bacterium]|nr:hypothetical protein [Actinomycetes bacterium]
MVEELDAEALEAPVAALAARLLELIAVQIPVAEGALGCGVVLLPGPVGVAAVAGLLVVSSLEGEAGGAVVDGRLVPPHG